MRERDLVAHQTKRGGRRGVVVGDRTSVRGVIDGQVERQLARWLELCFDDFPIEIVDANEVCREVLIRYSGW